jgi:hypothetical protein
MFILYAVLIGLALGLLLHGRPASLGEIRLHWQWLMIGGLTVQVALFSEQVSSWIGAAGPPLYVASTAVVVAAVLRNRDIVGMPIVAYGALCNLAAILANGGFMPASASALASLGKLAPSVYSNSSVVAAPELAAFTDQFALPRWLPFANVFSFGDMVIAIGVVFVIVAAMVRPSTDPNERASEYGHAMGGIPAGR